jgi:hypothetical protein
MTENLQPNTEHHEPFSPLQTGCALVMLTNMLIYFAVVLFTFNLLDPSKVDATYLSKRGFTASPEPKNEQDTAFQKISDSKYKEQQQIKTELLDASAAGWKKESSPAVSLSQIEQRKLESSLLEDPEQPKAALTESSLRTGSSAIRTAPSRLYYSSVIYHQTTLPQAYSPYRLPAVRMVMPERYGPLSVELASGIDFPMFQLPAVDPAGAYFYTPPNPVSAASRGDLKLSSSPGGAESLYTNAVKKLPELLPEKDPLSNSPPPGLPAPVF